MITRIAILLLLCAMLPAAAEDYQVDWFNRDKQYVPFSDYIPKVRRHWQTVPHYLEDYYELYGMQQYYDENSLRMNIARLKTALECRFRHPSEALVKVESEAEYGRYRHLMFMHINLLIMRNHMKIAARYDKRKIYFYNADFAKEISESLQTADRLYREAIPYWEKAKEYARSAGKFKITTDLGFMETERYNIVHDELDYGRVITAHLARVARNRAEAEKMLAENR